MGVMAHVVVPVFVYLAALDSRWLFSVWVVLAQGFWCRKYLFELFAIQIQYFYFLFLMDIFACVVGVYYEFAVDAFGLAYFSALVPPFLAIAGLWSRNLELSR